MPTNYTIQVINRSGANKNYLVFQAPPPTFSGQTPVYTNAWAALENVTDRGFDSVTYTVESTGDGPPRFELTEGAYAPGQVAGPPKDAKVATIDFTGLPQTTAVVTENSAGEFSVTYA